MSKFVGLFYFFLRFSDERDNSKSQQHRNCACKEDLGRRNKFGRSGINTCVFKRTEYPVHAVLDIANIILNAEKFYEL